MKSTNLFYQYDIQHFTCEKNYFKWVSGGPNELKKRIDIQKLMSNGAVTVPVGPVRDTIKSTVAATANEESEEGK